MFGAQSDQAMETVRTLAKDQGAKVQATASAVVGEALNIADEASAELGAKLPSGEEIVDAAESKVREANRLREASGLETPNPDQSDSHTDKTKDGTIHRPAGRKKMDIPPSTWSKTDEESDKSFPASDPPGNY